MWKLTEHRAPKGEQELRVKAVVKDMIAFSYASYAEQFETHFKQQMKALPKINQFTPEWTFKVTQRNLKSVEIWKMTVTGEFKYKLFTLDFIESKQVPCNNCQGGGCPVCCGGGLI